VKVRITCQRWPADFIAADVTIVFASGTRTAQIHFDSTRQIAGLRFHPPR
jgi:hypothetical protein